VHVYKFLASGSVGRFSGFRWRTGPWMEAAGRLVACRNGFHACRAEWLPYWLDDELWSVELGGEVQEVGRGVLVASRARLVAELSEWRGGVAREFAVACAERAERYGGAYAEDAATFAREESGEPIAVAAYVAAKAAEPATGDGGYLTERAWQAAWLRDRLALAG
jgi:hypothetical protein